MTRPTSHRSLLAAIALVVLMAGACGGDPPTVPPADELRDDTVQRLIDMRTATVAITHAEGGTDLGGGLLLTKVEGQAAFPDRATMEAEGKVGRVVVSFGIAQIEGVTYFRSPFGSSWDVIDPQILPINFEGMNRSVADALSSASDLSATVGEKVHGQASFELSTAISSESLRGLVTTAAEGLALELTVWIAQTDGRPLRVQMVGPLIHEDPANMTRILDLTAIDEDVSIESPI